MSNPTGAMAPFRSAVFVDFDNMYLALEAQDARAAARFAQEPARWIEWMEREMVRPTTPEGDPPGRRLLMRRCYLSPRRFGPWRHFFTRAGFEVVDCPALTTRGKNSADIRIVMDVLDTLSHPTRFDEFIILSSDSDFTPVLLRLRSHDRRTTILTVGNISGAYRSACDVTVESEDFIESGLGGLEGGSPAPVRGKREPKPEPTVGADTLAEIARRLHDQTSISGTLDPRDLLQVYHQFEAFRQDKNWLGYFGLRNLTEAVADARPDLAVVGDDPWRVEVVARTEQPATEEGNDVNLRDSVKAYVLRLVEEAEEPLPLVYAANGLREQLAEEIDRTHWAGAGTFKALLASLQIPNLEISSVQPGYLYDRERHEKPEEMPRKDELAERHPDLVAIVRLVHQVTNVPALTPEQYDRLYTLIAEEVEAHGYSLTETSKAVRDRCSEEHLAISRQSVAFVLRGLSYSGYGFGAGEASVDPADMARWFCENVLDLCENAGFDLSDEQRAQIKAWLGREPRES